MTGTNSSDSPNNLEYEHNLSTTPPLDFFTRAKSKSNDIFRRLAEWVLEAEHFMLETKGKENEDYKDIHDFLEMLKAILDKMARHHMKVAFFGRTSNGKSTVINAMLMNKILPSGIGHSTACFVQVEGTEAQEGFLLTDDSKDPKSISLIKQLASALSNERMNENSLIRIVWPKDKCCLLKEDVVIVDSPGIDIAPNLDNWIDKYCLDADVFVFVCNAESTMMEVEKTFFRKVSLRLSKPNIFILQNRWDAADNEEDVWEVKNQHEDYSTKFLTTDLKVEATNRIFFVSAKEALSSRLHDDSQTQTPAKYSTKNFEDRLNAFEEFERHIAECLSQSAVQTKFQSHSKRGKEITRDLRNIMKKSYTKCLQASQSKSQKRIETADKLNNLDIQLNLLTEEREKNIMNTAHEVKRNVKSALNDEIKNLRFIVDDFCSQFHPDNIVLNVNKKELNTYVQEKLERNVKQRCSDILQQHVETTLNEITDRLEVPLKDKVRAQWDTIIHQRKFEKWFTLGCFTFSREFQQDIQFRFSLGITSLMHKFLGSQEIKNTLNCRSIRSINPTTLMARLHHEDNEVLMPVSTTFATIISRSTIQAIGGIIVARLVTEWKVSAAVGSLYSILYIYEWFTWTNKAKGKRFKSQYVDYAGSELRQIVGMKSDTFSHQVNRELTSTFDRLSDYVIQSKLNYKDEILNLDKKIQRLEDTSKKAESFRNKADMFDKELTSFIKEFLQK